MANLPEVSSFDGGVYQLELTDPVQGGANGVDNKPLLNLANRTRWLYDQVTALQVGSANYAPLNSPNLTGSPSAPTPASGDSSGRLGTTGFTANAVFGVSTVNVAGGSNVVLTADQYGRGSIVLNGALTANISVIFPASGGRWDVLNYTTGAFTVTCKPAASTGVPVTQGYGRSVVAVAGGAMVFAENDYADILPTINGKVNRTGDSMGPLQVTGLTTTGAAIGNLGALPNNVGASLTAFDYGDTEANADRVRLKIVRSLPTNDWTGTYAELRRDVDGSGAQGFIRFGDPAYDSAGVQVGYAATTILRVGADGALRAPTAAVDDTSDQVANMLAVSARGTRSRGLIAYNNGVAAPNVIALASQISLFPGCTGFQLPVPAATSVGLIADVTNLTGLNLPAITVTNGSVIGGYGSTSTVPPSANVRFVWTGSAWYFVGLASPGGRLQVLPGYPINIAAGTTSYDLTWTAGVYERLLVTSQALTATNSGNVIVTAYRNAAGNWSPTGLATVLFGNGGAPGFLLVNGGGFDVASLIGGGGFTSALTCAGGLSGLRLAATTDTFAATGVTLSGA